MAPNVALADTLNRLEVTTSSSRKRYPAFDPEIPHSAVGCGEGALTLPEPDLMPNDHHYLKEQLMPTFQFFRPKVIQWLQIKIKPITQTLHVEL